ncbi:hypothetical protein GGX14DRAFT_563822 [Mycena pura]|uniref:Uncharacterized protein n=1 Tax=Mycena pura TaxID=153505 RepID=A0AAD6VJ27_9AGAR|nr:hypothetical protein GGX14DRAFT_563822 [Mycena pura]
MQSYRTRAAVAAGDISLTPQAPLPGPPVRKRNPRNTKHTDATGVDTPPTPSVTLPDLPAENGTTPARQRKDASLMSTATLKDVSPRSPTIQSPALQDGTDFPPATLEDHGADDHLKTPCTPPLPTLQSPPPQNSAGLSQIKKPDALIAGAASDSLTDDPFNLSRRSTTTATRPRTRKSAGGDADRRLASPSALGTPHSNEPSFRPLSSDDDRDDLPNDKELRSSTNSLDDDGEDINATDAPLATSAPPAARASPAVAWRPPPSPLRLSPSPAPSSRHVLPPLPPTHLAALLPASSPAPPRQRQKADRRKVQDWKEAYGYSPAPASDAGDEEDFDEMMDEIDRDGYRDGSDSEGTHVEWRGSREGGREGWLKDGEGEEEGGGKGKGKELQDAEQDASDGDSDGAEFKSGPIPQDILDRLTALHDAFEKDVGKLANECGKSPLSLHKYLGTVAKTSRQQSPWNIFQMWHAVQHPKLETTSSTVYNWLCRERFTDACPQLSKEQLSDSGLVRAAIPWLFEWHKETMDKALATWRNDGRFKSKVQSAIKPMVQMARSVYHELGVHVLGYVIDPQGQASYLWATTDESKAMRSSQQLDITQTMRDYETLIRVEEMKARGLNSGHAVRPRLEQGDDEANRDSQPHTMTFYCVLSHHSN